MDAVMNDILDEYRKDDHASMSAVPMWMVDTLISELDFPNPLQRTLFRKMICRIICEDRRNEMLTREALIQRVLCEHLNV